MNDLPTLRKFGEQLDVLKLFAEQGEVKKASALAQSIFENYVFVRDMFLRQEDDLLSAGNALAESEDKAEKLEAKLKLALAAYNSDFELFRKFCRALDYANTLKDLSDLPDMLKDIANELGVHRVTVVLDRKLCEGLPDSGIPSFFLKGCMRFIDSTLRNTGNRVFIGPLSRMMRPDVFFGDPEMSPESGGSCFAFGLMDKYSPDEMIGLFSLYDPSVSRFHPEMGTDFLEHFCSSIASTLIDVINHQKAMILREDVNRITHHDLKTPLNAVINLPHLLLAEEKDPDKIEMIQAIQDSGYRMLGLINRSYDLYKMESGTYNVVPENVNIIPMIQRIELDLTDVIKSKNSALHIFVDKAKWNGEEGFYVRGEELLLFSMLANLIKNGFEATPEGKPVTVAFSSEDNFSIAVHNYGTVPAAIRKTFFEKYSTSGKKGGTGLGTYSASLIARVHGGEIDMISSDEEGTLVTVKI
ncbi:HAMP domain-containing sensor histidine kinase [Maridesulfovibrio ferrireducens]|uniref:sensor histidine kinase n=1 Tax=Maridesulfovibrio ferrireducens TaxID=246191 RepID=UPI001A2868AA|nr:HAMP domain-containing sensor histidine kinase [Maridesulfovibrio ferrireducens]MBI9112987.1 HAMP domain-containing histidine kinase [Maridesulfovibrio ferrireducens]